MENFLEEAFSNFLQRIFVIYWLNYPPLSKEALHFLAGAHQWMLARSKEGGEEEDDCAGWSLFGVWSVNCVIIKVGCNHRRWGRRASLSLTTVLLSDIKQTVCNSIKPQSRPVQPTFTSEHHSSRNSPLCCMEKLQYGFVWNASKLYANHCLLVVRSVLF